MRDMNGKSILKNFNFGPCGDKVKLSHLGVAVKNSAGEMVSYDPEKKEIVNVDLINFGRKELVWYMPSAIKDIKVGDAILHNNKVMFVVSTEKDIRAVDVAEGEKKTILPTKSMFGFDFITKVVTMIDFNKIGADNDNPFGKLLPLMILGGGDGADFDFKTLLMMQAFSGNKDGNFNFDMSNPLVMMALLGGDEGNRGGSFDALPFLMMMSGMTQTK